MKSWFSYVHTKILSILMDCGRSYVIVSLIVKKELILIELVK